MRKVVGILDLGISNISSVNNAIEYLGAKSIFIKNNKDLKKITHLIIPGTGSYDSFKKKLIKKKFFEDLIKYIKIDKRPTLGICLGMQILGSSSEEGQENGIGIFDYKIKKLVSSKIKENMRIPNIGFRRIFNFKNDELFLNINENDAFYFLHSYAVYKINNNKINYAISHHSKDFIAAFCYENIYCVQFHPEKSQISGIKIFKNFLSL